MQKHFDPQKICRLSTEDKHGKHWVEFRPVATETVMAESFDVSMKTPGLEAPVVMTWTKEQVGAMIANCLFAELGTEWKLERFTA